MRADRHALAGRAGVHPQCLAATGGKPLLLRHLFRALAATGMAPSADAIRQLLNCGSRQLGEVVLLRLSQSGADLVRLATSVALLGQTELETPAAAAARLPLAAAVTAAATLSRMDVFDTR